MYKNLIYIWLYRVNYTRILWIITKIPLINSLYYFIFNKINPGIVLINIQGFKMYVKTNDIGLSPDLINKGIFEEFETKTFKKLINPNTILIDIGANIGYYTLIASQIIENGKIYSFEPELNNYKLLVKNIKLNKLNSVFPFQKAISNKIGMIKIFLDSINLGNHSLAKKNVPDQDDFIEVETITLDSFIENFDEIHDILIKIDTQGAEGLILEGAKKLLKRENLKIIMEFWPNGLKNMGTDPYELLNEMKNYGFKISVLDESKKSLYHLDIQKILNLCEKSPERNHQLNLLLEK